MPAAGEKVKPSLFGGFSDPPFISTDPDEKKTDPYIKPEVIPSRYTGQNFKIGRPKKGHGKDAYFAHEYLTFASSEQNGKNKISDTYLDPDAAERKAAAESKKKNLGGVFRYASPPKQSTGSGSFFGTFDGKPIPHMEDYKVLKRGDPAQKVERRTPKNILTMPPKKGTYGYIGTTFSKITGPEKPDEYDALRKKEHDAWLESKKKMITTAMFKTTIRPRAFFDEKPASGVSAVYDHFDPPEEKKTKKRAAKPKEDKSKIEGRPVFRYASVPHSGQDGCINKFPNVRDETKPDVYDSVRVAKKEAAKHAKPYLGGTWKPTSGPKSSVIKSLLRTFY